MERAHSTDHHTRSRYIDIDQERDLRLVLRRHPRVRLGKPIGPHRDWGETAAANGRGFELSVKNVFVDAAVDVDVDLGLRGRSRRRRRGRPRRASTGLTVPREIALQRESM